MKKLINNDLEWQIIKDSIVQSLLLCYSDFLKICFFKKVYNY